MLLNCGVGQFLRVPWTARRSNLSTLKEISPEYSLEGPMMKLNLHYFGQLMGRTISSSVIPFSSCLQSFPASGSFPMSQFVASGGQSIGFSASVSVLPMNIQGWFPLGLTSLISLLSKGLLRVFYNLKAPILRCSSLLYGSSLTSVHAYMRWDGTCEILKAVSGT